MSTFETNRPSRLRCIRLRFAASIIAAAALLGIGSPVHAQSTYQVVTTQDTPPGTCSGGFCDTLRAAIAAADNDPGSTIDLTGVQGTITLTSALPTITASTTFTGPNAHLLTISGNNSFRVFTVTVPSGSSVTLSGMTIANGKDPNAGGGLYVQANSSVSLDKVIFSGNSAPAGGAIFNSGTLGITNSTFSDNSAGTAASDLGGAIYSLTTLNVSSCTFSGNTAFDGSAIYNASTAATVTDSTFWTNRATDSGALYNATGGTLNVISSTLAANVALNGATGDVYNAGSSLAISSTILDQNDGCGGTSCPVSGPNGNIISDAASLKLAPLGYYGGSTPTLLPLPGSAAINAGSSTGLPSTDQRGFPFSGTIDAGSVQTNYVQVNTAADSNDGPCSGAGTCSLRDAMGSGAGDVDIDFSSTLNGSTILLNGDLPVVTGNTNVVGPGANLLAISGAGTQRLFFDNSGSLALLNLTLTNGSSASDGFGSGNFGGAILNSGTLTIIGDAVTNNSAGNSTGTYGGAIDNTGMVEVGSSTFSGNTAGSGSAVYNNSPVPLTVTYSTFSENTAAVAGALYNNSNGAMVIADSTFSGNSAAGNFGLGGGILNDSSASNSLLVTNTLVQDDASGAECDNPHYDANPGSVPNMCPAQGDGLGNVVLAATVTGSIGPLANYGGPTSTILPLPGSAALCAGNASFIPSSISVDQRGFANENTSYTGYSPGSPCVDAGAVQTNFTSAQFIGAPYTGTVNQPVTSPAVVLSVTENGQNIGSVPVTLTFSGSGTATGTGPATTIAGTGVSFSSLTVNQTGTDQLSASIPVVGTDVLNAGPVDLTINSAPANTTTTVWNPPTSIPYGTSLSEVLTATADANGAAVNGTFSYTAQLAGGAASAVSATTVLPVGTYTLQATFVPADPATYQGSTATASLVVTPAALNVIARDASRVYGTANPAFSGSVTGAINGDVFTEAFSTTASITSNAGTYPIFPSVSGASLANYTVSTTDGILTVTKAATDTSLSLSGNSVNPGTAVTLTSTVVSATTGTPTGTVSFYDGSSLLGTATLAGSTASYSTTTLAAGATHSISAVYNGDLNFTGSTASTSTIIVAPLSFTMQVNPSSQTGNAGSTFTWQLTLAPAFGNYPGNVTFAATGLPPGATATFSPNGLAANAGQQTVTMSVSTAAATAQNEPFSPGRRLIPVALALMLLPLGGTARMRRNGRRFGRFLPLLLLALAGITATAALTGCGTDVKLSNPPGTKTYTITVTAASATAQQTGTVTLNLM